MALVAGVELAVQLHIARGDGVNDRDHDGKTPLMIAASVNKASLCQMLLAAGADPNMTDNYGRDALHIAQIFGSDEAWAIIERSRQSDAASVVNDGKNFGETLKVEATPRIADAEEPDEPYVPQSRAVDSWIAQLAAQTRTGGAWAKKRGYPALPPVTQTALRDHLAHGEDIDVRDGDGRTALMIVAALNKPKMCRLLLEAGADPKLLNKAGKDVLDIARAHQADAAIREIERAVRTVSSSWETSAPPMPQPASMEPPAQYPGELAVDFGSWTVEPEAGVPTTDGAILARAMEIQRAIADHVPVDASVKWDVIDIAAPPEAKPASAPEVKSGQRVVRRPSETVVTSLADALTSWGRPAEISSDTSDGATASEAAASSSPPADAKARVDELRATTWEAVRRRNEEAANRKRQARGQQPAMASPAHEAHVVPSLMKDEEEPAMEVAPAPPARPWPSVAPVAAPASHQKRRPSL